jgi:hypothetical protein
MSVVRRSAVGAGVALILAAVAFVLASVAEFAPGELRGNGDDPSDSVAYLQAAPEAYAYSGAALIVAGIALVVGVLGWVRLVRHGGLSTPYGTASAFGVLAGGFALLTGVMRLQATGTVPHIAELDRDWGEAAYLVVQLAGTQGALSAAMLTLSGWLVATAILAWRRRVRWMAFLGIAPLAILLLLAADIVIPGLEISDSMFLVYVGAITVGLPLGCLGTGIALLIAPCRARLASPRPGPIPAS